MSAPGGADEKVRIAPRARARLRDRDQKRLSTGVPMLIRSHVTATFFLLSACHTYSHVNTPEEAVARASKESGTIRVTKTDHSVVTIWRVAIVADSLVGIATDNSEARVAIPLKDVSKTETSEINAGRSFALGGGIVLGLVAALGILAAIAIASAI